MKFISITCEEDYQKALMRYLRLCCAAEGSPEWVEAELLRVFIEEYEQNECDRGLSENNCLNGEC